MTRRSGRRSVILATALVLGLGAGKAGAEETRWNIHLEQGAIFNVQQPARPTVEQRVGVAGYHLRFGVEYQPLERLGIEAAYAADIQFLGVRNTATGQQGFLGGLRFRPWYHRGGGFLLGPPRIRVRPEGASARTVLGNVLSDVWIDAHVGASLADRNRLIYDVGVGTRVPLAWPIQLGFFVRWQQLIAFGVSEVDFKQISLGLVLSAGFRPVRAPADTDRDGVPDAQDSCPGTPRGSEVNEAGCIVPPNPAAAPGTPQCSDTDLDGICDGQDSCPDTPLGTPVDERGCPPPDEGGEK